MQFACTDHYGLPKKQDFQIWLDATIPLFRNESEITIRLVDEIEIKKLNQIYRGINKPTNVLSFSFKVPSKICFPFLGDIVICRQSIEREAIEQKKTFNAHWAHTVIHGSLHLLGYDHIQDKMAIKMEKIEKKIMKKLGYPNPYLSENF